MDRDAIEWTEGDWLSDTEIVEILPVGDDAALASPPGQVDGDLGSIANGIRDMLEKDGAGKGRVFFGREEVVQLRGIAERLCLIAREISTS